MYTHNLCLEQKYENSKRNSTENCHFYSREKSLYVAWACFRCKIYISVVSGSPCYKLFVVMAILKYSRMLLSGSNLWL